MGYTKRNSSQWLFGIVIFIIGIVFLIENLMDVTIWEKVWLFWPLLFVLWGLAELFQKKSIFLGIILIGIGAIFFMKNFGLYQWPETIWKFWPVIIIAIGFDQMFKRPPENFPVKKPLQGKKEIIVQDDEII